MKINTIKLTHPSSHMFTFCVISVIQDSIINCSHHVIHEIFRPYSPYSWSFILFCQPLPISPSPLMPGTVLLLFLWVWLFFLICVYKWYHAVQLSGFPFLRLNNILLYICIYVVSHFKALWDYITLVLYLPFSIYTIVSSINCIN